jgi:hypothetical protein
MDLLCKYAGKWVGRWNLHRVIANQKDTKIPFCVASWFNITPEPDHAGSPSRYLEAKDQNRKRKMKAKANPTTRETPACSLSPIGASKTPYCSAMRRNKPPKAAARPKQATICVIVNQRACDIIIRSWLSCHFLYPLIHRARSRNMMKRH